MSNLFENFTAKSANNSTIATIKIYINPPWKIDKLIKNVKLIIVYHNKLSVFFEKQI